MKLTKLLALGLALTLASCSDKKEVSQQENADKAPSAQLVLDSAPEKAIDIADMRKSAKPGDTVTFTGEVIGSKAVFMDGRAVMIMGDPKKLTSCDKNPDDQCSTPWDVCCDDPDVITASIVTVQVIDDSGKPVKSSFKDMVGVSELSTVTVNGSVAESSNEANMIVNATGIFVHPKK